MVVVSGVGEEDEAAGRAVVGGGGVSARSVLRGDSRVEALYQPALFGVSRDLSVKRE